MRVLVVEDNRDLSENIKEFLVLEKFVVEQSFDGQEGLNFAQNNSLDCIVLDLNLPKLDGVEVCKKLREKGNTTPIIMLTARTGKDNIITGLDSGADDYLTKPFELEELVARIKALVRRAKDKPNPFITYQNITLDTNAKKVFQEGKEVDLAPKEYLLLEYLLLNLGIVQDRTKIIEHVWGEYDNLMFSQTVDVHVAYVRKKLGKKIITTASGGYFIERSDRASKA